MPTDKPRVTLMIPNDILKRIEDVRYNERFPSQSAAILALIVESLDRREKSSEEQNTNG